MTMVDTAAMTSTSSAQRQSSISRHTASTALKQSEQRHGSTGNMSPVKRSVHMSSKAPDGVGTHDHDTANIPRAMDKSTSMNDIAAQHRSVQSRSTPKTQSLYLSSRSASSHTLSSISSPRRLGLGARTISPTELRKRSAPNVIASDLFSRADGISPRKVSGIPSPVKAPSLGRARPSPIPPVPPLPAQLDVPTTQPSPKKKEIRSISGPVITARNRSATIKESTSMLKVKQSSESSFTSPVKTSNVQIPATQRKPNNSQLQPINLPPLNVPALSTPTIRRVNDMSQRLQNLSVQDRTLEETRITKDNPTTEKTTPSKEEAGRKSSSGFFGRLSRASSFRKSRASRRKDSSDLTEVKVTPEKPESKRRLSINWKRGKMSPFGSQATAKYDHTAPPSIPKSFTSESLASQVQARNSIDGSTEARPSSAITGTTELADDEMKKSLIARKGAGYLTKVQTQVQALEARASVVSPVEATQVSLLGGSPLNLYEKGEVIDYDGKIYFTGQRGLSKSGGKLEASSKINFGYDDDRGDYIITPGDHFAYRYEIVDVLGKGSFGQVLRCIDYRTGSLVAIKVIRNKKRFHAQALVEVNILQRLREWDPADVHHLIKYTDHFYFRHHLCIATDLLGMNLYEYIKANDFKGCTLNIIRSITTQILSCLCLLKRQRVIHCDLKPENILLVNAWESKVKIIDFGSSCFEDQKVYTYIQSRFYRSPEVILGMSYGLPIDMWSMGCILAELYTGYPLFPGEDEQEQLSCIMEVFGPPEKHLIENSTRKKLFFDSQGKPRSVLTSKGRRRKPSSKTLSQALKCQDESFLDFLTHCLRWNPQSRLTPDAALEHPFISGKPLRVAETPAKKRLFSNTPITPRPLPNIPKSATSSLRVKSTSYRNASGPMLSKDQSPGKHRRIVSNLPVPRDRVFT